MLGSREELLHLALAMFVATTHQVYLDSAEHCLGGLSLERTRLRRKVWRPAHAQIDPMWTPVRSSHVKQCDPLHSDRPF
jgi:hypothetical protein